MKLYIKAKKKQKEKISQNKKKKIMNLIEILNQKENMYNLHLKNQ